MSQAVATPLPALGRPSPARGLLVWLLVQLAALALGASHFRLSENFPEPAERLAFSEMLIAQIVGLSIIFPLLLDSIPSSLMALATSLPFVLLASFLSNIPPGATSAAWIHLAAWMVTLHLWRRALPNRTSQLLGAATATAITLGGPLFWYLRGEFVRQSDNVDWGADGRLGPIMGNLSLISHSDLLKLWPVFGTFCGLAILTLIIQRFSRQVIHRISTAPAADSGP